MKLSSRLHQQNGHTKVDTTDRRTDERTDAQMNREKGMSGSLVERGILTHGSMDWNNVGKWVGRWVECASELPSEL